MQSQNNPILTFLLLYITLLPFAVLVLCCIILVISRLSESGIIAPPRSTASETNEKRKANVNHNILNIVYKIILLLPNISSY